MGAKKTNIVIGILVLIIACLSIVLYRVTRLSEEMYELNCRVPTKIPLDVFVTGLTEAVDQQEQIRNDVVSQNEWLRRHLERTLEILEAEYNLKPIFLKTPYPSEEMNPSEGISEPDIFVTPYRKTEYESPLAGPNEDGLRLLKARINLNTHSIFLATYNTEYWIENFYERLQRLEQTIEAAKKGN